MKNNKNKPVVEHGVGLWSTVEESRCKWRRMTRIFHWLAWWILSGLALWILVMFALAAWTREAHGAELRSHTVDVSSATSIRAFAEAVEGRRVSRDPHVQAAASMECQDLTRHRHAVSVGLFLFPWSAHPERLTTICTVPDFETWPDWMRKKLGERICQGAGLKFATLTGTRITCRRTQNQEGGTIHENEN